MVKKTPSTSLKRTKLKSYEAKRNFKRSPEPKGSTSSHSRQTHVFVIHKHAASRLHYDLRLECEGVLRSWAIPRGPSMDPLENRLAVRVEDHPLTYQDFEGVIPKGNYGAGSMIIWDEGSYTLYENLPNESHDETFLRQYRKGSLKIEFHGQKLRGRFTLVKLKKSSGDDWLLLKKRDEFAMKEDILKQDLSTRSGKTVDGLTAVKIEENPIRRKSLPVKVQSLLKKISKKKIPEKLALSRPKRMVKIETNDRQLWHNIPHGMLAVAIVSGGAVKIKTVTGLNLTPRCADVCKALEVFPDETVFVGVASLTKANPGFYICDVLWLAQHYLATLTLEKRWQILSEISFADPLYLLEAIAPKNLSKVKRSSAFFWCRDIDAPYEFGASNEKWTEVALAGSNVNVTSGRQTLTNPSKVFWPEEGYTKKDLYEYYRSMADILLPHLRDRPQSLHRHPDGISGKGFFQKEVAGSVPGWVATTNVPAYGGTKTVTYLLCQDVETLLYMINMGCIELNPWLSRVPDLLKPDFAVIDIDPGSLGFRDVIQGAKIVQKLFEKLKIHSFCKTSGSRGIHIYVPTNGKAEFSDCQKFAELVGEHLRNQLPDLSSTERNPMLRRNKLYIDALQNRKGQTMASPYSVRPKKYAPVSTPIAWSELTAKLDPNQFTIESVPKRVAKLGDLWKGVFSKTNDIRKLIQILQKGNA